MQTAREWLVTATLDGVAFSPSVDAIVPLDTHILRDIPERAAVALLGEVLAHSQPTADHVRIYLPPYRPATVLTLLSAVAGRLCSNIGVVSWFYPRKEKGLVRRTLTPLGWILRDERIDGQRALVGHTPSSVFTPIPACIPVRLGSIATYLHADYGVFSSDRLDDGTDFLLTTALSFAPVKMVADIGTGYGPLAIGMVMNRRAVSAVASDVDAFALYLASRNARELGLDVEVFETSRPADLPPTPLTLCNVPTHLRRDRTETLMDGLAARARNGPVLLVVHASLEVRYTEYMLARNMTVTPRFGNHHVVLIVSPNQPGAVSAPSRECAAPRSGHRQRFRS